MAQVLTAASRWIGEAFTTNLPLKVLSLVVAIGLVAYTRGQMDETQRTILVPVNWRLPPESAERELMTQMPPNVEVTVQGTMRAIDSLMHAGVPPIELNLGDGRRDTVLFDKDMFSLPPDVEIKIIHPPSLNLEWQDIVSRTIPVQASRTGQPAPGYEVKDKLEVDPKQLTVRGPASLVEVMQFARLAAFDVTGLTEGVYRRRLAIDEPPPRVKYVGPKSATVTATVTRRQTEVLFKRVPVEVVGASGARAIPRQVDVTVTGPPEVVSPLRAEQIAPRVDLASAGINTTEQPHGSATLKVKVELANADALVQPPTVAVRW